MWFSEGYNNSQCVLVKRSPSTHAAQPTQGPTLAPLILNCSAEFLAESQQVSVSCTSSRDLDGLDFECSFNDSSVTEGCEFWCLCCMPSSIVCWSRVIDALFLFACRWTIPVLCVCRWSFRKPDHCHQCN